MDPHRGTPLSRYRPVEVLSPSQYWITVYDGQGSPSSSNPGIVRVCKAINDAVNPGKKTEACWNEYFVAGANDGLAIPWRGTARKSLPQGCYPNRSEVSIAYDLVKQTIE
jgi:hypothetical protein